MGDSRKVREILGDRPLMAAAVFSVALHAAFYFCLGDWPPRPPRRARAVMVVRLLKPSVEQPEAVPVEMAADKEDLVALEERLPAADPEPAAGYDSASASLTVQSGAGLAVARGGLRFGSTAVVRASSNHIPRRAAVGRAVMSVPPSPAGEKQEIEAALREIRKRIEAKKTYPLAARRRGWEGEVLVELELGGAGELEGLRLLRHSGFPLLDRATLTAVRAAVPFPPVPGRVKIPISYRLVPD